MQCGQKISLSKKQETKYLKYKNELSILEKKLQIDNSIILYKRYNYIKKLYNHFSCKNSINCPYHFSGNMPLKNVYRNFTPLNNFFFN